MDMPFIKIPEFLVFYKMKEFRFSIRLVKTIAFYKSYDSKMDEKNRK